MSDQTVRIAIIQQPSKALDSTESLRRAAAYVREAGAAGANLVAFPESWLSCYASWAFGMAEWDDAEARHWYGKLLNDSVVLGSPDDFEDGLAPLRAAAIDAGVTVSIGINERSGHGAGSIFNSQVTIGADGTLLNVHRKLTPTHTERIVWGEGDGAGLRVVDTTAGRVGGLICWEHFHPLARQALHAQGEQIHVAAWPDLPEAHEIASRQYAFEGRCFVVVAAQYLTAADVPAELVERFAAGLGPDVDVNDALFRGGSGVIGPDGKWVVGPVFGRSETVIVDVPISSTADFKHDLDVAGHYSRSDVFDLRVNTTRRGSVTFEPGR